MKLLLLGVALAAVTLALDVHLLVSVDTSRTVRPWPAVKWDHLGHDPEEAA